MKSFQELVEIVGNYGTEYLDENDNLRRTIVDMFNSVTSIEQLRQAMEAVKNIGGLRDNRDYKSTLNQLKIFESQLTNQDWEEAFHLGHGYGCGNDNYIEFICGHYRPEPYNEDPEDYLYEDDGDDYL